VLFRIRAEQVSAPLLLAFVLSFLPASSPSFSLSLSLSLRLFLSSLLLLPSLLDESARRLITQHYPPGSATPRFPPSSSSHQPPCIAVFALPPFPSKPSRSLRWQLLHPGHATLSPLLRTFHQILWSRPEGRLFFLSILRMRRTLYIKLSASRLEASR